MSAVLTERAATTGASQHRRRLESALAIGWLLLATLLQLVRSPGVPTWRAVFGEDGGVFLTDAVNRPGLSAVLRPYQGYLQLAPRLVSACVAPLPLEAAAVSLAVLSALVVAGLSLYVVVASRSLLSEPVSRAALAVLIVALPVGYDINASATNLHWYLDAACAWVFLAPARRRRDVAVGCLVAAASVLSDPLVGLFLPLAVGRAVHGWRASAGDGRRRVRELVTPAVFAVALAVQGAVVVLQQSPTPFVPTSPADLPQIYGERVAASLLVGDRALPALVWHLGPGVAFVSLLLVGGLLAIAVVRGEGGRRVRLIGLVGFSVLWLVVPLLLRGTVTLLDVGRLPLPGSRYIVNPLLLLATALLLAAERPPRTVGRRSRGQLVLVAVLLVGVATSFRLPAQRTHGPVWSVELAAARARCAATAGRPGQVGRSAASPWGIAAGPGDVLLPVAPTGPRPAWSVLVPCKRL